jgi:DNA polymerase-2
MPTVRGAEEGSKKRYAGLVRADGGDDLVFKGLETVRTDWTPLAQTFQRELYRRVFKREPYQVSSATTSGARSPANTMRS